MQAGESHVPFQHLPALGPKVGKARDIPQNEVISGKATRRPKIVVNN